MSEKVNRTGEADDLDKHPRRSRRRAEPAGPSSQDQESLMQLTQATVRLETAVEAQLRLADPDIAALGADLLEVLRPAIKQTLMEVVEMAA